MKWNTPITGDKRIIKKFLFLPKEINHEVRWFENVNIEQVYSTRIYSNGIGWIDRKFIDNVEEV